MLCANCTTASRTTCRGGGCCSKRPRHPNCCCAVGSGRPVAAIAQVYGLQVGVSGPLQAAPLLRAIATSVQRTFGRDIVVQVAGEVPHLLPETEAIPVALTVNELLTNAIKHGSGGEVRLNLAAQGPTLRQHPQPRTLPRLDVAQVRRSFGAGRGAP